MRTIAPALKQAILDGKIASLVKITTKDGSVFGYTDHDKELTIGGTKFIPAPGLQRIRLDISADAKVSSQEAGSAWVDAPEQDLIEGKFDEAEVEVMWVPWEDPSIGTLTIFSGDLGLIEWTEEGFKADIQSAMRRLRKNIGFEVTAACRHELFSQPGTTTIGACRLAAASYTKTGSVQAITTPRMKFTIGSTGWAAGFATNGKITFTSGLNNGLSYEVKTHLSGDVIELMIPTFAQVAVGDTYSLQAGCDKTWATCGSKFNNQINFGGFPHIKQDVNFQ
jgi:uncharacterized phage protein (TIGR02218 family)